MSARDLRFRSWKSSAPLQAPSSFGSAATIAGRATPTSGFPAGGSAAPARARSGWKGVGGITATGGTGSTGTGAEHPAHNAREKRGGATAPFRFLQKSQDKECAVIVGGSPVGVRRDRGQDRLAQPRRVR